MHTLFYQAWQEQAVLEYDSDTRDTYYTKVFNSYMKVACCIVAILIPLSKVVIVLFMDESYLSSYKYVGILYLGAIFSSFSSFYGTGYISAKDTKNAMKTTIVGAIVNFLINLILIPFIGIWAALCGVFSLFLLWVGRKFTKAPSRTEENGVKISAKKLGLTISSCSYSSSFSIWSGIFSRLSV